MGKIINMTFKYIDLFCGIGGFRYGLEQAELGECVWSCDTDDYARSVYKKHWNEPEASDIREIRPEDIPEHDLLCGGFPCQNFSIAGKREGLKGTRGTLFFEICKIIRLRKPTWLLLENVEGLLSAQNREAFGVILKSLDECGYNVSWQLLNSKNFGVPQNRSRVFIIGHIRAEGGHPWKILPAKGSERILDKENTRTQKSGEGFRREVSSTINKGYNNLRCSGETYINENNELIRLTDDTNQADRVYSTDGIAKTIAGNAGGGGAKTGLYLNDNKIRKLTPRECERLQGFPDDWTLYGLDKNDNIIEISDTQRYKMLGNAVTTNVIEYIANRFKEVI